MGGLIFFDELARSSFVEFEEPNEPDNSNKFSGFGSDLGGSGCSCDLGNTGRGLYSTITTSNKLINPYKVEEHSESGYHIKPEVEVQEVIFLQLANRYTLTKERTVISIKKKIIQIRLRMVKDKSSSGVKKIILKSSAKRVIRVTKVIKME